MRIIREGDLSRLQKMRRFACRECGCVWEAGPSEYRTENGYRNDVYYVSACPTCGMRATTGDGERAEG